MIQWVNYLYRNMSEFKDKVVIITGASSGIGAGTAVEYAKHGAHLVLGGRNEANLNKTAEKCMQMGLRKDQILQVIGDVTHDEDCYTLVDKAVARFGQIDIVINNAGSVVGGNLETCTIGDMDLMYKVHVRPTFIICKRAAPHLIKTKGSVVNISSIAGTRPLPYVTAYGVAKAALIHLSAILAQDFAPSGVNVNCITPGVIHTDIFVRPGGHIAHAPEKEQEFLAKACQVHPLGRIGNVEEVAGTILYLTSKAAGFVTGAVLPIDGGRHGTCTKAKL